MKTRFPLYAKIVLWFFLNLIFLGVAFFILARVQFHFGLDSLVSGPAGARIQAVTDLMSSELRDRPQSDYDKVMDEFSAAYKVQFSLFRDGNQIGGKSVTLPAEVRERMMERRGPNPRQSRPQGELPPDAGPPDERSGPPPMENGRLPVPTPGSGRKFMMHTMSPSRYWVIVPIFIASHEHRGRPEPTVVIASSESLSGGGLFFDLTTWLIVGAAVVVVSILFWFPLVRGITRSISRMTRATEQIAEGRFDVRTNVRRQDELGFLSEAINRMAERLAGFVAGQKRFLGDIAHELCSPIARIQVALGILEQRVDEKQKVYLQDLREEVEQMSTLVNELLSFTKASMAGANLKLQPIGLRALVEKAVDRECALSGVQEIKIEVLENLQILADQDAVLRAVGNLIRNAIAYAGQAGPITVLASQSGKNITLIVEDCGPGIPDQSLAQVFDPFYRVDVSRARETGGVGLGLAIVKSCIESCGGTVHCENRDTGGLRVVAKFVAAES